jgi:hypothetical protein
MPDKSAMLTTATPRVERKERRGCILVKPVLRVSGAGMMREDGASEYTGISTRQLRRLRAEDKGPKYSLICGRVWYSLTALNEYLANCEHETSR